MAISNEAAELNELFLWKTIHPKSFRQVGSIYTARASNSITSANYFTKYI